MIGLITVLIVVIAWLCFKVDGLNKQIDIYNNMLIEEQLKNSNLDIKIRLQDFEIEKLKTHLQDAEK